MKVAFIISEIDNLVIGGCLSSAKMFYIYDELSKSYYTLELPDFDKDYQKAKVLSEFLKKHRITNCVGNDLGPKAKASLEEQGVMWFDPQGRTNKEDIIKQIKNI